MFEPGRFSKAVPAALKCVVFVGLHLAVRLIPSPLKMKTGEGAVNPHQNFFFWRMRSCESSKLSAYWLVVWHCRVDLTCEDHLILSTLLIAENTHSLSYWLWWRKRCKIAASVKLGKKPMPNSCAAGSPDLLSGVYFRCLACFPFKTDQWFRFLCTGGRSASRAASCRVTSS